MAKKKPAAAVPEAVTATAPAAPGHAAFAYHTRSRCPKCGRLATRATATREGAQYRKCLMPSCRTTYKVQGSRV